MRKRSTYRPRPVLADPAGFVVESMRPIGEHDTYLLDLKIRVHAAMAALTQGRATKQEVTTLIAMNNISNALFAAGFGVEYEEMLQLGGQALMAIGQRGLKTGRYVARGPELTALNALLDLHDAQMAVACVRDVERALDFVRREDAAGRITRIKPA